VVLACLVAVTVTLLAFAGETEATGNEKGVNTNSRDCHARTALGQNRTVTFVAKCLPPTNIDLATLGFEGFSSTVPIRRVRRFGSVGKASNGMRCHRRDHYSVICHAHKNAAGKIPDLNGAVVRGAFTPNGDQCEVIAQFNWDGGGCVGFNPENNICAGVGLAAGTRFGPPAGC
jgi:hypothetical protein